MDQNGSLLIYFFFFGRGTQFNPEFSFVTLHPFYKVFSISCAVSGTHLRGFVELHSLIHWFLQPPMFASLESLVLLPSVGFNEASAVLCLVALSCLTLRNPMDCSPPSSSVHGDSSGKNTGVGCQALLQGIFPTEGSNPGLPHCRLILYQPSHQGSPQCQCVSPQMSRRILSPGTLAHSGIPLQQPGI